MTSNSIPIRELFSTCKAKFLEFGMAEKRIYSFRCNYRSLIDFMETNSFNEYNHEVCDAFLAFENENPNIPKSRKSRNHAMTTLINLVLDGVGIKELTRAHIIRYLTGKTAAPSRRISATRVFLRSIYEDGITKEDLSDVLKGYGKKERAKMVSYYSPEEIRKIESSIDRSSKTGKRITLPLLSEVGDALIDYIVNARPKCNIKTVFTRTIHP